MANGQLLLEAKVNNMEELKTELKDLNELLDQVQRKLEKVNSTCLSIEVSQPLQCTHTDNEFPQK